MVAISVIIPIYNVQKYLHRCMDSIINQTLKDIEIILVNDGSPDGCPQICDDYRKMDSRIHVIHKKNEGLGFARNSGLDIATGKYIMFIDSDDYLAINACEIAYNNLEETNSDACVFDYYFRKDTGEEIAHHNPLGKCILEQPDVIDKVMIGMIGSAPNYPSDTYIAMSVWKCVYSNRLIKQHHVKFPSERECVSEDIIFQMRILPHISKICILNIPLYYYCENATLISLTKRYDSDKFDRFKNLYSYQIELLDSIGKKNVGQIRAARRFLGNTRVCIKQIVFNSYLSVSHKKKYIKQICDDDMLKSILKWYPWKENPIKQQFSTFLIKFKLATVILVVNKVIYSKR